MLEKAKLFRLVLFNFLVGNEDMHLKNYSVIRNGDKTELSPAYDLLNTTIVLNSGAEEIALSIAGKKKNLKRKDLVDYFGKERCGLTQKVIELNLESLSRAKKEWSVLLEICFLSNELKEKFSKLLNQRLQILQL